MLMPAKSTVKIKLADLQKKDNQAIKKADLPRRKNAKYLASLRAIRLSKETFGREAAEDIAAANWAAKSK